MTLQVTLAAIGLTATVFTAWFLYGLLRDRASSIRCRLVPIRIEPERNFSDLSDVYNNGYVHNARPASPRWSSAYFVDLLENQSYAKKSASGLIACGFSLDSARDLWRSIQSEGGHVFREQWL